MNRIVLTSRVGMDGVLRLAVPVGTAEAESQMQVTIEPVSAATNSSDYLHWLDSIAGRWQGEFEQFPTADFEQRDAF